MMDSDLDLDLHLDLDDEINKQKYILALIKFKPKSSHKIRAK